MSVPVARTSSWLGRRYLFEIGGFKVPSYSAMLYLGSVAGIFVGALVASSMQITPLHFALISIVLLIPALIGARLWYVLQNHVRFRDQPQRILRPLDSGAAQDGGLILSFITSVPVLDLARIQLWSYWDAATITLLIGTVIARFGCLMNGCCSGRATNGPLGIWMPNHKGEWQRRFPTPVLEASWSVVLLIGLFAARPLFHASGAMFACAIIVYALGRPLIALTRETDRFPRMMRISLAVSLVLLISAMAILVTRWPA